MSLRIPDETLFQVFEKASQKEKVKSSKPYGSQLLELNPVSVA